MHFNHLNGSSYSKNTTTGVHTICTGIADVDLNCEEEVTSLFTEIGPNIYKVYKFCPVVLKYLCLSTKIYK